MSAYAPRISFPYDCWLQREDSLGTRTTMAWSPSPPLPRMRIAEGSPRRPHTHSEILETHCQVLIYKSYASFFHNLFFGYGILDLLLLPISSIICCLLSTTTMYAWNWNPRSVASSSQSEFKICAYPSMYAKS